MQNYYNQTKENLTYLEDKRLISSGCSTIFQNANIEQQDDMDMSWSFFLVTEHIKKWHSEKWSCPLPYKIEAA